MGTRSLTTPHEYKIHLTQYQKCAILDLDTGGILEDISEYQKDLDEIDKELGKQERHSLFGDEENKD